MDARLQQALFILKMLHIDSVNCKKLKPLNCTPAKRFEIMENTIIVKMYLKSIV